MGSNGTAVGPLYINFLKNFFQNSKTNFSLNVYVVENVCVFVRYLAWIDETPPDEFLVERTLSFLRAFLGVPVEMLELSKDLSRPTHFEQLGITVYF